MPMAAIDTLLLDAYHPNLAGGTGKTLNWQALQDFQPYYPWLLAGGLTPITSRMPLSRSIPTGSISLVESNVPLEIKI